MPDMTDADWRQLETWLVDGPPDQVDDVWPMVQRLYLHYLEQNRIHRILCDGLEAWIKSHNGEKP